MLTKQYKRDCLYMDIAIRTSEESYAIRKKVGAVIVHNDNIIAHGWNGMPPGMPNECEYTENGILITKLECRHAEFNAIAKLAKGTGGALNSQMYVTLSPCIHCANLIKAVGISRVIYLEEYRDNTPIIFLRDNLGIATEKFVRML